MVVMFNRDEIMLAKKSKIKNRKDNYEIEQNCQNVTLKRSVHWLFTHIYSYEN